MKKLLLLAAFGVAGFVSAKDVKTESTDLKKENVTKKSLNKNSKQQSKVLPGGINWIGVSTWCGKVFYLNANDYSNSEELDAAAAHFTQQQCAQSQSTAILPTQLA